MTPEQRAQIREIVSATNHMTRVIDGKNYTGGYHGYYALLEQLYWFLDGDHGENTAKAIFKEIAEKG